MVQVTPRAWEGRSGPGLARGRRRLSCQRGSWAQGQLQEAVGDPACEPPQIEQNRTFVSPRRPQRAALRLSSVSSSRPSWRRVGVEPGPRPATLALGQLALCPLVPLGVPLSSLPSRLWLVVLFPALCLAQCYCT